MDVFEYYTYEVNHKTGGVIVYGWDHHAGSPRKNFVASYHDVREARSNHPGVYDTHPANDVFHDK